MNDEMENYQALKFKCLPVPAATYKIREQNHNFLWWHR